MPINDDFSKPIKLIEKCIETFQMDPIMKSAVSLLIMYY